MIWLWTDEFAARGNGVVGRMAEGQSATDNEQGNDAGAPAEPISREGRLGEVAAYFLRLGFTAFGGPAAHIAMMRDEVVRKRKWVSEQRFLDLLGVINMIPGPNSTELAIYLGYERAGWLGLFVGGGLFILPAFLIVLALAWAYGAFGSLPQVEWLLYGVKPVVIAIVLQALWGLARTALKGPVAIILGLGVVALYLLGVNIVVLLFGGALLYGAFRLATRQWRPGGRALLGVDPFAPLAVLGILAARLRELPVRIAASFRGIMAAPLAPESALALATVAPATPYSVGQLFLTFLKIGAVIYGSGYTLLAFLHGDFVQRLGWLTDKQLLDAVSVGQFTPGPVFTTATFVGYITGGWSGAVVATLAIFLPSFAYIALFWPVASWLRARSWSAPLLDGLNVAALALMAGVTIQLARAALVDVITVLLAGAALLILLRWKVNSAWLIAGGALVGLLAHLLSLV
jgi:chromate transporter